MTLLDRRAALSTVLALAAVVVASAEPAAAQAPHIRTFDTTAARTLEQFNADWRRVGRPGAFTVQERKVTRPGWSFTEACASRDLCLLLTERNGRVDSLTASLTAAPRGDGLQDMLAMTALYSVFVEPLGDQGGAFMSLVRRASEQPVATQQLGRSCVLATTATKPKLTFIAKLGACPRASSLSGHR